MKHHDVVHGFVDYLSDTDTQKYGYQQDEDTSTGINNDTPKLSPNQPLWQMIRSTKENCLRKLKA